MSELIESGSTFVEPAPSALDEEVQEILLKIDKSAESAPKGPKVTQSAIKGFFDDTKCKIRWSRIYQNGEQIDDSDPEGVLNKGLYFEYHLLGATRDGKPPKPFPLTNRGGKYKWHEDLDNQIEEARMVMKKLQIKPVRIQGEITAGTDQAHYDLIALFEDPQHLSTLNLNQTSLCLFDIKWTETRKDDKWKGWAEPEYNQDAMIQAKHYIHVFFKATGVLIPFYFLVFGKTGWVRLIRVGVTDGALAAHHNLILRYQQKLQEFQPYPIRDWETCLSCGFLSSCEYSVDRPIVQEILI